jgi:UDP-sulfoquinovose synthase
MKTVLVCGSEGYIGHALVLRLEKDYKVIGFDNYSREKAVRDVCSYSAIPLTDRQRKYFSVNNYWFLCKLLASKKPDIIINLAQQPSAPYSHLSRKGAKDTTVNNLIGTLNVLYAIHETGIDTQLIQIGSMGEFDPVQNIAIPEWYHASKVASTYYIDCACRWWGINATDIMQGIVYGMYTPEIDESKSYTRLDSDECFGTVVHRFVVQAILGEPLTIYGKGKHKRGFIALNDSIQALMLAVENPGKGYRTWNQLDTVHSIEEIADRVIVVAKEFGIKVSKQYIETPRKEVTEEHYYSPVTEKLEKLGFRPTRTLMNELYFMIETLLPHKERLEGLRKVIEPRIKW